MYQESARFYDWICRGKDYMAASEKLVGYIQRFNSGASTLLDVGCGTGRHLAHLDNKYKVSGLDISPEMLKIAHKRCPGVSLHQGDLTRFSLHRKFDVITCLFGSVAHANTVPLLNGAIKCMARHLSSSGILVLEPWVTPDSFRNNQLNFEYLNDPDLKVARMYISRRRGRSSIFDIEYQVGKSDGITHFSEHIELGLFTSDEYLNAFRNANLQIILEDAEGLFGYGLYIGKHMK